MTEKQCICMNMMEGGPFINQEVRMSNWHSEPFSYIWKRKAFFIYLDM